MEVEPETVTYTAAGGVVVDSTGDRVLLLMRPSRDEVRLPKGHVKPGETVAEAAVRETREEAGYADLAPVADLGEQRVTFRYKGKRVERTERYFLMRLQSERTVERPKADAQQFSTFWVGWDAAMAQLTFEAEKRWVQRAQSAWEVRKDAA